MLNIDKPDNFWNTYVVREELLDNIVRQLIDFNVFVVLQDLNLGHTVALFDHVGDLFGVWAGQLQHVVDTVQNDL